MAQSKLQQAYIRAVNSAPRGDDFASRLSRNSLVVVAIGVPDLEPLIPAAWRPNRPAK